MGFRHVALATRAISIAARALHAFNATANPKLLKVALDALSVAIRWISSLGAKLEAIGFVNASKAMKALEANLSSVKSLVATALSYAEKGSVSEAKSLALQALQELRTIIESARAPRTWLSQRLFGSLTTIRKGIATCVADELGSLALAKSMLAAMARHAKGPSARLEAQQLLLLPNHYTKILALHPCLGYAHHPHWRHHELPHYPHPWRYNHSQRYPHVAP